MQDIGQRLRGEKALVYHQFSPFGVFNEPLVRIRVAPENEAAAIPIQSEAYRAVKDVNRRERADLHTVLMVDHALVAEIKLVRNDLAAL